MKHSRALKGNDCEKCFRRFSCLSSDEKDACPIVNGWDIKKCHSYYMKNNLLCVELFDTDRQRVTKDGTFYHEVYDRNYAKYRIRHEDILWLLRTARFKTTKKYGVVYLELIIDENWQRPRNPREVMVNDV